MLIEAARRAEAAATEMLSLVNEGSVSCADEREALAVSKAFMAAGSAFQAGAARIIAQAERHGDGGTQVLADAAGMPRRDAHNQVKTARVIEAVPAVRDAVESGRVSQANAKRLADAIERTGTEAVASDGDLLAKAESMRPEQFVRETRRWVADRDGDSGASEHRRQRARRCLRVWDGDDGMVQLRGQFDAVTGRRITNRLRAEASRLYDDDKTHAGDTQRRSFDQCMADALDNLTSSAGGGKPFADICVVAHVDDATGELIAELPDGDRLPKTVLEQLACNAKLTGVVYDRKGKPIWRTQSRRTVTEAQWQLLIAKWGGCFHCGANPGICQGHHIEAASQGGPTKLDNLVPACWSCHHRIHHHNWQIHKHPHGHHTLHPPDPTQRIHHGPAHAPDHPPPTPIPAADSSSRNRPAPPRRANTTHPASTQSPTPGPEPPRRDDDDPLVTTTTQPPTPGPGPPRRVPNRPQNPQHEPLFTLS